MGLPPTPGAFTIEKVPSPLPWQINTLVVLFMATARSSLASSLKSATAMEMGMFPAGAVAKLGPA